MGGVPALPQQDEVPVEEYVAVDERLALVVVAAVDEGVRHPGVEVALDRGLVFGYLVVRDLQEVPVDLRLGAYARADVVYDDPVDDPARLGVHVQVAAAGPQVF